MSDPNNYWLKRRRYGYGWTPITWQGWTVVLVFILAVLAGAFAIKDTPENTFTKEIGFYLLFVPIGAVTLVRISAKKGPKPKWRWGRKPSDNSDEDY